MEIFWGTGELGEMDGLCWQLGWAGLGWVGRWLLCWFSEVIDRGPSGGEGCVVQWLDPSGLD